ncbi:trypsin-like peptidase domain-containing protein [Streptomyces sp. NPDC046860]|uniref:trypsin-like peptidase domain-containing protein n=1 Tax=Streptomyces sp. NPDC046860 TaxID=3154495 RepID=UPI0033E67EBD
MNEGNPTPEPSPSRTGGDFELARPKTAAGADGTGAEAVARGGEPGPAGQPEETPTGADSADRPDDADRPDSADRPAGPPPGTDAGHADGGATTRPRPLHDPDPYGTPPYGGPGPWAPAPPVQHPMATPAHGTPSPQTPPGPSAPAPPVPPDPAAHTPVPPPDAAPDQDPAPRYDPWNPAPPSLQARGGSAPLQHPVPPLLTEARRGGRARRRLVGAFVGISLLAGGVGGFAGAWIEREGTTTVRLPQAGAVPDGRARDSVAGIAARALPSVVTLHVRGAAEAGTGTGFVLDGRGHILTNNHVVAPASADGDITVTFSSGDTAEAELVGRDSGYDLAVVRVKGVKGLTPLPLGDSDGVRVGDPVVAIGAPFDLANTVTSGIVSARERPITAGGEKGDGSDVSYVDALQTDAPINPGNSGGPLLDSHARVIGINSAIRSAGRDSGSTESQSGSIGLGFAIPVNQARRVAEELINDGHATHPVIGVTLDMDYSGDGARIGDGSAVVGGGPGDRAGLKPGDLITEVDGHPVHSGEELIVRVRAHRPGDRLRLTVGRPGAGRTVTLKLGAASGEN